MKETNRIIAGHFSRAASTYEASAEVQKTVGRRLLSWMAEISEHQTIKRILDVGSGTGEITQRIADRFLHAEVIGLDIAQGMVAYAKEWSGHPRVRYKRGDVMSLSGRPYSLIFSNAMFHWVVDLKGLFVALKNVLHIGGSLYFSIYLERTYHELREIMEQEDAGYVGVHPFVTSGEVRSMVHGAGLRVCGFFEEELCESYRDYRSFSKRQKDRGTGHVFVSRSLSYKKKKSLLFSLDRHFSKPFMLTHHIGSYLVRYEK